MSITLLRSMMTECSTSLLTISQPSPIAENGPTKLSAIRAPAPITSGPRRIEFVTVAPRFDDNPAVDRRRVVDLAVDARFDHLEQQSVCFQQRRQLSGVDPPTGQQLAAHPLALIDQPLDCVGDLQFAPWRRSDRTNSFVDGAIEQVHADQGKIAGRIGRLLDETNNVPGLVEFGDAEAMRIGNLLQQDLHGRRLVADARSFECVDEGTEILLEQVVTEIHHEVVVAEKLAGDEHAMGKTEGASCGMNVNRAPKREPSPSAAITSARVSPTITPISVMPAATIASIP